MTATRDEGEALVAELIERAPHPDPYPLYRRLREIAPVFRSQALGAVFVTGHAENIELHTNPRLRTAFAPKFTPRRVEELADYVQGRVDLLLDLVETRPDPDLSRDFAQQIPAGVICHLLGLPESLHDEGLRWARSFSAATLAVPVISDEVLAAADHAVRSGTERLEAEVQARRMEPTGDLLSDLVLDARRRGRAQRRGGDRSRLSALHRRLDHDRRDHWSRLEHAPRPPRADGDATRTA
ncbi:MAG: hypothetical protein ACRDPE_09430 [Solirubrobacterales bacterium]